MAERQRRNKDIAGYQILLLLANADSDFDSSEGKVIANFIAKKFPLGGNLETAMEEIATLSEEQYSLELQKLSEDFYADSTEQERYEFLQFAMDLVKADEEVVDEEDWMIGKLYQYWDITE